MPFSSQFHICLLIRNYKSKALTTRWPSIPVRANWSGGRWRADSFLSQGSTYELPWSAISSSFPVALMKISTTSPRSSPGTRLPSPGNLLENSLWRETTMLPSLFQNQLLANASSKWIQYIKYNFENRDKRTLTEHEIHNMFNSALFSVAFTSRNYTSSFLCIMSTWTESPNRNVD